MNHLGTETIETNRLILRRFVKSDIALAFKNWVTDERVTEFLTWEAHKNIDITDTVISSWIQDYEKNNFYQWAIILKEINEPIGSIGAVSQKENLDMVHIGYCIGYNWWNKGIVSEAFSAIIKFFFEQIKVNRIESLHDSNNPASGKVMLKCGLKYEGTLRQAGINNKGIVDTSMYSILADEYRTNV
ncbi:GNAT family N-acetyltransferase [Candidatus Epulonipiscioides gigas]|nr:GNAT family N-acetyltransferase [Epulopiscium sp. SCG-C07WGA-EpuloA2]